MNQEDYDGYMDEFVRQTSFSDRYRGESIAKTFPELYQHVRPWFEKENIMELQEQMQFLKAGNKHDRL
jgi:hypothetical protein